MLGLVLGWDGLSPAGSFGGRVCLSGFRGSEGGWDRGGGAVGKGLVGWGILSGGPGGRQRKIYNLKIQIGLVYFLGFGETLICFLDRLIPLSYLYATYEATACS